MNCLIIGMNDNQKIRKQIDTNKSNGISIFAKNTSAMALKRILSGLIAVLTLISCANNGEQLQIKLKQTQYDIGYEGGVIKVEFLAIRSWYVFCWQEGISIAPESGKETNQSASFTMTIAENPKPEPREFEVTFTSDGPDQYIYVYQAAAPTPPEEPKDPSGGTEDVIPGDNL